MQADLARLAAYGIAMEDLRNAIAGANVPGPKGSLDGAHQAYTIAANDQIAAADAYKPIIIAYRNGAPVTIGDVAQIVDGLENDRTAGWYQGVSAVIIDIQRQPGARERKVVQLYFIEGRSYEEISTELNIPINLIGVILRGLARSCAKMSESTPRLNPNQVQKEER